MIKGNESATPKLDYRLIGVDDNEAVAHNTSGGLTIFQELSARFMAATLQQDISPVFEELAKLACDAAEALIDEWNHREEKKSYYTLP